MKDLPSSNSKLDPKLRERLLRESKSPLRGPRRLLWIALFGSAFIGLLVMLMRFTSGEVVVLEDSFIQFGAVLLFGLLLWFDRERSF